MEIVVQSVSSAAITLDDALARLTNEQHLSFVEHYIGLVVESATVAWNGSEAAKRAGYKQPGRAAWRLLKRDDVRAAIDAAIAQRREQYAHLLERAVDELYNIATSDIGDVMHFDGDRVTFRSYSDIPANARRCIESVRQMKDGVSVKFYSKTTALHLLAKITGGIVERHGDPDGRPLGTGLSQELAELARRNILGIRGKDEGTDE